MLKKLFCLLAAFLCSSVLAHAQTKTLHLIEELEPGLVLKFIPRDRAKLARVSSEPLGVLKDNKSYFNAGSYEKEVSLAPYGDMPHGLLWQGFYHAEKAGPFLFSGRGKQYGATCKFEFTLSDNVIFSYEGGLNKFFDVKHVELHAGMHQLEAWIACNHSGPSYLKGNTAFVEVKRPGESTISTLKPNELYHRQAD